jgi:hypothetical protein
LDNLTLSTTHSTGSTYSLSNSYFASADLRKYIGSLLSSRPSKDQLAALQNQVNAANKQGLKVRYWGNPTWPVGLRNQVWNELLHEGVDVINPDNLRGATRQDWKSARW